MEDETPRARLLAAARRLGPQIAAVADEIERERRLPEPLVQQLAAAGLFRLLVPRALGGSEADLVTFALAIEAIAEVDGSTGWCVGQAAGAGYAAGELRGEAATRIYGDPRCVVAWGPGGGSATPVPGGYRLSGRWSFASGCHHATWLGGDAAIVRPDGGADDPPVSRRFLFPAAQATFSDVWQVSGLRGTGSDSFAVSDLFVPEDYVISFARAAYPADAALYAVPLVLVYAVAFASVALGIGRGALDAFATLADTKTPRLTGNQRLRDNAVVQAQIGRAEAKLRAAHAFLHETIADAWAAACAEGAVSHQQRVLLRLCTTHAIHTAARVVGVIYHAAGASAIFTNNAFERRFRDSNAVTQQIQGAQGHFETAGRFFLHAEGGPRFL